MLMNIPKGGGMSKYRGGSTSAFFAHDFWETGTLLLEIPSGGLFFSLAFFFWLLR